MCEEICVFCKRIGDFNKHGRSIFIEIQLNNISNINLIVLCNH
ncbi:hypothetical protein EMUCRT_0348 [Ehrlichia cf. muris str. EmCRT]|uniref:Uncharacterized protein n=1 Tax=Ehrlichia cf. muris str. EmCRT TaxID=1359167 RepID=A0A0F3NCF3_9RICK|nr:hypothetical protein EMUCRT_0348 [Ehrlichia cf. muris str. EmCRT]